MACDRQEVTQRHGTRQNLLHVILRATPQHAATLYGQIEPMLGSLAAILGPLGVRLAAYTTDVK